MEGGKIAQCWTKHFSSLQSWSHWAVLYIILVCKASAGEQKAAFAMEIGIPDKRSENTLLRGEFLISSNKISWKLYQIKKIIENVSVFNRDHEQENNPTVNSMKNSQVQPYSEGQKWRFIPCELEEPGGNTAIRQRDWKPLLALSSSCKINILILWVERCNNNYT